MKQELREILNSILEKNEYLNSDLDAILSLVKKRVLEGLPEEHHDEEGSCDETCGWCSVIREIKSKLEELLS